MRNVETIIHTSFSLRPHILYITMGWGGRFGLTTFSTTLDKDFVGVEGMSEIQAKRFSYIDFHLFALSMDKNHLVANEFYRFRFLSIGNSGMQLHPELHRRYADLNCKKLPNTSHHKILNLL